MLEMCITKILGVAFFIFGLFWKFNQAAALTMIQFKQIKLFKIERIKFISICSETRQIYRWQFADDEIIYVAIVVVQFSIGCPNIDASFLPTSKIVRISTCPERAVHFPPVRPEKLSRLASNVRRSNPVTICKN